MHQTRVGGDVGNCFEAALATILHFEVAEIPEQTDDDFSGYLMALNEWLEPKGMWLWGIPLLRAEGGSTVPIRLSEFDTAPAVRWIAAARTSSPEWDHALVCVGRHVVHDPYPPELIVGPYPPYLVDPVVEAAHVLLWRDSKGIRFP